MNPPARGAGSSRPPDPDDLHELADRLHSAAIHLLRKVRVEDAASGLTASRLSALSVIVLGPIPISQLAGTEQVSVPSMSRLVRELEKHGLVERVHDQSDRRLQLVRATERGRRLLREGRRRRVTNLAQRMEAVPPADRETLARAAAILDDLSLPPEHPRQS